ncbi:MAG: glycosyltransferase, partial [Bacteroidetes bacterium]
LALNSFKGEIMVVDNASDDGSVDMVKQKFPRVTLIANQSNVGYGVANNQAARTATGEILFFLNPDTIVQENTFTVLINFFKNNNSTGLAGCKVLNPDGTLQPACRRSFPTPWVAFTKIIGLSSLFPDSSFFSKYNLTFLHPDETYEVDAVSGSCMAIRNSIFQQAGGFDEQFFMYGEDLDLCYRVKKAGWKVHYVHSTQIIHYKGESVRRSDINDVRVFYHAMHLFVKKHFHYGVVAGVLLRAGILLRELLALFQKHKTLLSSMAIDYVVVIVAWFMGEWLRFGAIYQFPPAAYPVVFTILPFVVLITLLMFDVYTGRRHSSGRTVSGVVTAFVILSALTFFFKDYAFSRFVLLITGVVSCVALLLWREIFRARKHTQLFSRRTLIVGASEKGIELLLRLRSKNSMGYNVVGFIHNDKQLVGEQVAGVEVLGSLDSIGKVIQQHNISDVIFSSDTFTYAEILSVISGSTEKNVNYRLVPSSLEVIIGKTHIDELNDLPLVDIEYNVHRLQNRIIKRCMDIFFGMVLVIALYPVARARTSSGKGGRITRAMLNIPKVIRGAMSIVGFLHTQNNVTKQNQRLLVKPGITGLAQVNNFDKLSVDEIAQYNVYYAKNQSFMLDLEILLKTIVLFVKE